MLPFSGILNQKVTAVNLRSLRSFTQGKTNQHLTLGENESNLLTYSLMPLFVLIFSQLHSTFIRPSWNIFYFILSVPVDAIERRKLGLLVLVFFSSSRPHQYFYSFREFKIYSTGLLFVRELTEFMRAARIFFSLIQSYG